MARLILSAVCGALGFCLAAFVDGSFIGALGWLCAGLMMFAFNQYEEEVKSMGRAAVTYGRWIIKNKDELEAAGLIKTSGGKIWLK